MIRTVLLTTVAAALMAGPVLAQTADATGEARARRILERTPLIDGHNDLPWALRQNHGNDPHAVDLTTNLDASTPLHTDIPRLRRGGMGAQFWSVYVPADLPGAQAGEAVRVQIDLVRQMIARYPAVFEFADTADETAWDGDAAGLELLEQDVSSLEFLSRRPWDPVPREDHQDDVQ